MLAFRAMENHNFKLFIKLFINCVGNNVPQVEESKGSCSGGRSLADIDADIKKVGDTIRDLKAKKSAKEVIDKEVQKLLAAKAEFKSVAGKDWDPKGNILRSTINNNYTLFISLLIRHHKFIMHDMKLTL